MRTRLARLGIIAVTSALAGCGSSHRAVATGTNSDSAPAFDAAMAKCATTFQLIITSANPGTDPAWVNYFLAQNQARGLPVSIGQEAYLGTNDVDGLVCMLTFTDPSGNQDEALFVAGHTSFDGSSEAPVLEPAQLAAPQPNVQIGANGALKPLPSAQ
jgi:hypothetical protein